MDSIFILSDESTTSFPPGRFSVKASVGVKEKDLLDPEKQKPRLLGDISGDTLTVAVRFNNLLRSANTLLRLPQQRCCYIIINLSKPPAFRAVLPAFVPYPQCLLQVVARQVHRVDFEWKKLESLRLAK